MAVDFRASQFRGAKFITSGSTGTGAKLLVYDIAADTGGSNTGTIDVMKFVTSSIGTDILMYVSGTVSSGSSTDRVSVFGGSLRVSGALTIGSSSIRIDSNSILFSSSSAGKNGGSGTPGSALIQVADTANGSNFTDQTGAVVGIRRVDYVENDLVIKAGTVFVSGSGGSVFLQSGDGGYRNSQDEPNDGGDFYIYTGHAGVVADVGFQDNFAVGAGGDLTIKLGSGSVSPDSREGGLGGALSILAGKGGANTADAAENVGPGGLGGTISIVAGTGGAAGALGGDGGFGGNLTLQGGTGGATLDATTTPGDAGSIFLYGGDGPDGLGGIAGAGGTIYVVGGEAGFISSSAPPALGAIGGSVLVGGGAGSSNFANGIGGVPGQFTINAAPGGLGGYSGGFTTQRKAGDINFTGATVEHGSASLSGSNIYASGINRIFFNANPTIGEVGFPGQNIGFYVSGTKGTVAGAVQLTRVAVFGGDVVISGNLTYSGSSVIATKFIPAGFYASTTLTSSNPQVVGQTVVSQSEVNNTSILLRSVLSTTDGSKTATIKLWNISSASYVEIGGTGVTTLTTVSTTPVQVQSVNLLSAINFGTGSNIYEVQVYIQTGSVSAIHGSSTFVCT